jgi:ParB family chromosome partitioning protein
MEFIQIRLDKLNFASPLLRKKDDKEKFEQLKKSITACGVLIPVIVKKMGKGEYVIIDGNRRVKALNELGMKPSYPVPALTVDADDPRAVELGLVENIVREELSPLDEMEAINVLVNSYNRTQEGLAQELGKGQSYISQLLAVLSLPKEILQMVRREDLSVGHGRVLTRLSGFPDLQKKFAERTVRDKLSKSDLEVLVSMAKEGSAITFFSPIVEEFKDGSRVRIEPRKNSYRIEINYNPEGDIETIFKEIRRKIKKA